MLEHTNFQIIHLNMNTDTIIWHIKQIQIQIVALCYTPNTSKSVCTTYVTSPCTCTLYSLSSLWMQTDFCTLVFYIICDFYIQSVTSWMFSKGRIGWRVFVLRWRFHTLMKWAACNIWKEIIYFVINKIKILTVWGGNVFWCVRYKILKRASHGC